MLIIKLEDFKYPTYFHFFNTHLLKETIMARNTKKEPKRTLKEKRTEKKEKRKVSIFK